MNNGINPSNPRKGFVKDYTLKIGNRASLIPLKNERAHGIVMQVDDDELTRLYGEKSVADYIPEKVDVIIETGEQLEAICYNLPLELLTGTNESYAESLYKLSKKLDFPKEYLNVIRENFSEEKS